MSGLMFLALLVLMGLSVPIAVSLGLASIVALGTDSRLPFELLIQRMFVSVDSFSLLAVPFFILAGELMGTGGISKRLVQLASAFMGHIAGGLAAVTVLASMFFGSISGSSAATVAALGSILIPAMIAKGYSQRFAASTQAVAGELGHILPPSIPMILYGVTTGTSIGSMFIAGIIPGILLSGTLIIFVYLFSKYYGYGGEEKIAWKERFVILKDSFFALLMPFIILGGIYGGIFTPTEAAAVAVAYALFVGMFIYKEIKVKDLMKIFSEAGVTTAKIMVIISTAGLFGWMMTQEMIPQKVAMLISEFTSSKIVFLIIVNIFLFIVGMFFENGSSIIILAPILAPIAESFGVDPVHFGIIMIVNLAMGMVTPPLGVNLFIASSIARISLIEMVKGVLPFLVLLIIHLLLLSYLPVLSLWLVQ